jgi:hypothetical protein
VLNVVCTGETAVTIMMLWTALAADRRTLENRAASDNNDATPVTPLESSPSSVHVSVYGITVVICSVTEIFTAS